MTNSNHGSNTTLASNCTPLEKLERDVQSVVVSITNLADSLTQTIASIKDTNVKDVKDGSVEQRAYLIPESLRKKESSTPTKVVYAHFPPSSTLRDCEGAYEEKKV